MPIDPAGGQPFTETGRQAERLTDLERRLAALERGAPTIQVLDGPPTNDSRDGTPAVDATAARLYLRVAGTWRYTELT